MQRFDYHKNNTNKKAKRLNLRKGSKPRNPSQTNGTAKIQINLEPATNNLKKLSDRYHGVSNLQRTNTFIPNEKVILDEYVYYGKNISKIENPLSQIINSIIGFLQNGKYVDTTGVAFKNSSPQTRHDSRDNIK